MRVALRPFSSASDVLGRLGHDRPQHRQSGPFQGSILFEFVLGLIKGRVTGINVQVPIMMQSFLNRKRD